jgi:hypothetical protein
VATTEACRQLYTETNVLVLLRQNTIRIHVFNVHDFISGLAPAQTDAIQSIALLPLPRELRNKIYDNAISHPQGIQIGTVPRDFTALARTSRQLNAQARLLPFQLNIFRANYRIMM